MSFNAKKAKLEYQTEEGFLKDQRKDQDREEKEYRGTLEDRLSATQKGDEVTDLTEKQMDSLDRKEATTIQEERLGSEDSKVYNHRHDKTSATNTIPVNELAEERQKERLAKLQDKMNEEVGEAETKRIFEDYIGDQRLGEKATVKIEKNESYADYKKENLELSKENFARIASIDKKIMRIWKKSSSAKLSTDQEKEITKLKEEKSQIIIK